MQLEFDILRALGVNGQLLANRVEAVEERLHLMPMIHDPAFRAANMRRTIINMAQQKTALHPLAKAGSASLYDVAHLGGYFDGETSARICHCYNNGFFRESLTRDMADLTLLDGIHLRHAQQLSQWRPEQAVAAIALYEETDRFKTLLPLAHRLRCALRPGSQSPTGIQGNVHYFARFTNT